MSFRISGHNFAKYVPPRSENGCLNRPRQSTAHLAIACSTIKTGGTPKTLRENLLKWERSGLENEQKIYDFLHQKGPQLLDVISLECNIATFQLSSILLQMELKGVTKPLPGKLFELI